jgi:ubiquinone/menaquinone biosynthesis C-methylase UbiE
MSNRHDDEPRLIRSANKPSRCSPRLWTLKHNATMLPAQDVAARFDRAATTYDDGGVHRWLAEQVAQFAAGIKANLVLDVATGTGLTIEAMISLGSTANFTGIDISAGMLAQAARKPLASRTDLRLADGNQLPFAADAFDLTICVSAMPYFTDPARALAEWRRVTRHGRIIFTAWTQGGLTLPRLVRQAATEVGVHLSDPNAALASADNIQAVTANVGLSVERLTITEHCEPLQEGDAVAWHRVTGSEFGAPMRAASQATQEQAVRRFHHLLANAISAGEPNRSRTYIVETTEQPARASALGLLRAVDVSGCGG